MKRNWIIWLGIFILVLSSIMPLIGCTSTEKNADPKTATVSETATQATIVTNVSAQEAYTLIQEKLNDPDFLIDKLTELAPELPEEKKHELGKKLQNDGWLPETRGAWPESCGERLTQALPVSSGREIDPQRLVELLILMYDFIAKMDPLIWSTW